MKKYTLKDLSEGKVILERDGSKDEAEKVNLAFPKRSYKNLGFNYYLFNKENLMHYNSVNKISELSGCQEEHLPIQKAADFDLPLTEEDLIGDLSGFPIEIVERMLECQVEQGNSRNVTIFQKERTYDQIQGGFTWRNTIEGKDYWSDIINCKDFSKFKPTIMEQTLTREQLKELHDKFDCQQWKDYIIAICSKSGVLVTNIPITQEYIEDLNRSATHDQKNAVKALGIKIKQSLVKSPPSLKGYTNIFNSNAFEESVFSVNETFSKDEIEEGESFIVNSEYKLIHRICDNKHYFAFIKK